MEKDGLAGMPEAHGYFAATSCRRCARHRNAVDFQSAHFFPPARPVYNKDGAPSVHRTVSLLARPARCSRKLRAENALRATAEATHSTRLALRYFEWDP